MKERKEYCENNGTYPHGSLSIEGVSLKSERFDRDFLVKEQDKKYKVTRLNDICYNPANLKFGVITRNRVGTIIFSPIYVTFEINQTYDSKFIELFVTNPNFIKKVRRYEQGTVYERMAVSSEDFLRFKSLFPSLTEQRLITKRVEAIETKMLNENNLLRLYCEQKHFLLSQLFI